jgi:hypothetical protein
MASKDPTVRKQGTAGKTKHPTVAVPQEHEIIKEASKW